MRISRMLLALALLWPVVPSYAHEVDPLTVTVIDAIEPPAPDLTIEVRSGAADQLLLVNATPEPVEVLDDAGAAFLRITRDGVEGNVRSQAFWDSMTPLGAARAPETTGPAFRRVSAGDSWGWYDHRLHPRALRAPLTDAVTRLADWTVPLRHGGRAITVRGHVEYRPPLGHVRVRYAALPPDVDLDLLDGRVPGLFLRYVGTGTLTVYGIDGAPFARLGPRAEVNERSATWADDQRLRGVADVPASGGTPRWKQVAPSAMLTWLDRRLAYAPGAPPADALRAKGPTVLVEWDIKADVNGTPYAFQGTTEWVPNARREHRPSPWTAAVAALAVLPAAAVMVWRRRRAER